MSNDQSLLDQLVSRYERLHDEGQSPSLELLCADNPHLVEALRERVDELLSRELAGRYDRLRQEGQAPSVDELCAEHPHLKARVRVLIDELGDMQWMDDVSSLSGDESSLVLAGGDAAERPVQPSQSGAQSPSGEDLATEEFVSRLRNTGLLRNASRKKRLDDLLRQSPDATASSLAQALAAKELLTEYQRESIFARERFILMFGKYEVTDKIGAGGMGEVYKCRHTGLGTTYALKVLGNVGRASVGARERFLRREMRAAAELGEHPNIVGALAADEQDGIDYFVMEFVQGEDLDQLVEREGPLPVGLALDYIRQAACGLAHAHQHDPQILHRDIKPANLLVDSTGRIRITDFGLARMRDPDPSNDDMVTTVQGRAGGTPAYMAPEQATDLANVDQRADIYSLGCTLHTLLTGKDIYPARNLILMQIAHQKEPIPDLRKRVPQVSDRLQNVFRKMVAKRPEDRYPSVHALRMDLERVDRELAERPTTPTSDAADEPSGTRGMWAAVVMFAVGLILLVLTATRFTRLPEAHEGKLDLSNQAVGKRSLQSALRRSPPGLEVIDLSNTRLPSGSLQPIEETAPDLRELFLGGTRVDDADLRVVGRLESLRVLTLEHTSIAGAGLGYLGQIKQLNCLFLPMEAARRAAGQGGSAWSKLSELPLTELGLVGGEITVDTLDSLRQFSQLQRVTFDGARFTGQVAEVAGELAKLETLTILRCRNCQGPSPQWLSELNRRLSKDCPNLHVIIENAP